MIHMIDFHAMGCQINVQVEADDAVADYVSRLPKRIATLEDHLSRFKPDSELMRLNAQAGEWVEVSDVLFQCIRAAKHAALLTDGLYNPLLLPAVIANGYDRSFEQINTVKSKAAIPAGNWREIGLSVNTSQVRIPSESALDLGGIGKGWAAGYIADELWKYGACLVDMGGDMVGRGAPEGFEGWPVEIEDPLTNEAFAMITLLDSSLATSGTDYRRWKDTNGNLHHHIIDPRTGESAASDILAATVIHPHASTAEAYAKAVLLQGAEDGLNWLNQQWYATGLVFKNDGTALATSTFTTLQNERNTLS